MPAPDPISYELPDGQVVKAAGLRMAIPELLFSGDHMDAYRHLIGMRSTSAWLLHYNSGVNVRIQSEPGVMSPTPIPLPKAVHSALLMSPPEIRRDLSNNVLLTGGGSNLHNIQERLKWELIAAVPAAFKPRVVAPSPVEREFATWIGGSVLGECDCARMGAGSVLNMWLHALLPFTDNQTPCPCLPPPPLPPCSVAGNVPADVDQQARIRRGGSFRCGAKMRKLKLKSQISKSGSRHRSAEVDLQIDFRCTYAGFLHGYTICALF